MQINFRMLGSCLSALLVCAWLSACGDAKPDAAAGRQSGGPADDTPDEKLTAVECVIKAERLFQEGDKPEALKLYDEAIKKTSDNPVQMRTFTERRAALEKTIK